jgi:hypothetical protein
MELRRVALELFQCRHCEKAVQTTEKTLCDALLCTECFDLRAKYRQEHPSEYSEKMERNWFGDRYGAERSFRTLACASCGSIYQLVDSSFQEKSLEDQKCEYERGAQTAKAFGNTPKPFRPIVFSFDHAPKGWTNDILCKCCFENAFLDNIEQARDYDLERTEQNNQVARNDATEAIKKARLDAADNFSFRVLIILVPLLFIFLIVTLGDCNGPNNGELIPRSY